MYIPLSIFQVLALVCPEEMRTFINSSTLIWLPKESCRVLQQHNLALLVFNVALTYSTGLSGKIPLSPCGSEYLCSQH